MAVNLTSGAISKISTGKFSDNDLKPVLQVTGIDTRRTYTRDNKLCHLVMLSDGHLLHTALIAVEIFILNMFQKGSILQLTKFQLTKGGNLMVTFGSESAIWVLDYNLLHSTRDIIGYPRRDPPTSTQKCSSHSSSQNEKLKLQSSDDTISGVGKDISDVMKMTLQKTIEDGLGQCYRKLGTLEEGVSKMMEKNKEVVAGFKKLETLEEGVSKMTKMMMEKNTEDNVGACFKKLGTLKEGVSRMAKTVMEKNTEDDVGACFKKLETLEEKDVSKMTKTVMDKNKEDDVGVCFKKLETLEEDVSKLTKMMMDKNKEDDVGACFKTLETLKEDVSKMKRKTEDDLGACYKKLETLEKDVSKLTIMMMEKSKEDDMGACIEKLDKMGWGADEPIYDTALLLFLKGADYRKLWLHLKPECCGKWVKIAGSMFGLLD